MSRRIENPILNSPFDVPTRHFRFGAEGITDEVVDGRRPSQYFMPVPAAKRKGGKLRVLLTRENPDLSTRGRIAMHVGLRDKPSGCVVNLRPVVGGEPERITFRYDIAAGKPGKPYRPRGLTPAKKAFSANAGDGTFVKAARKHHLELPKSKFRRDLSADDLLDALFGNPPRRSRR